MSKVRMSQAAAQAEAEKRERHKPRSLQHKRWQAVHDDERGWRVALADCPFHAQLEAERATIKAREALRFGSIGAFMDAAGDALMARVRARLAMEAFAAASALEARRGETGTGSTAEGSDIATGEAGDATPSAPTPGDSNG